MATDTPERPVAEQPSVQCFLVYLTTIPQLHRLCSIHWVAWVRKEAAISCCKEGVRKTTKTCVRMTGIRTNNLSSTKRESSAVFVPSIQVICQNVLLFTGNARLPLCINCFISITHVGLKSHL